MNQSQRESKAWVEKERAQVLGFKSRLIGKTIERSYESETYSEYIERLIR